MKNLKDKINIKYLHILIIILGIIFISIPIFHNNLWFDEAYSVGISKFSYSDIWSIGSNDVHPIFYYYCLHTLYLIFGANLIIYRIFSMLTIALLAIMGYTHIRKDFGEKVGIYFSFLILFLPFATMYSGEIRMYSLGMLLGSVMAIYAYRIYKKKGNFKFNIVIFGIMSLLSAYTHYYGLMLAGLVNLSLFFYFIKNLKENKKEFKIFISVAIIQVILYLPWLICFLNQLKNVSSGFWIVLTFPDSIYEIITMQFKGNFSFFPIMLTTLFYTYIFYIFKNIDKKEKYPVKLCFIYYLIIIIVALIISIIIQSVIILYRYLLIITGLLVFAFSFIMANDKKPKRAIFICLVILAFSIGSNVLLYIENYDTCQKEGIDYLVENVQDNDIIIYADAVIGATITTQIYDNTEVISYFYNMYDWNVAEAYKAFGEKMQISDNLEDILEDYQGKIWIIENAGEYILHDKLLENYEVTVLEEKELDVKYKDKPYRVEEIYVSKTIEEDDISALYDEFLKNKGTRYYMNHDNLSYDTCMDYYDCSSWVIHSYAHTGIITISNLSASGIYDKYCYPVSEEERKPGDLIFLKDTYDTGVKGGISHVGIYIGKWTVNGKTSEWVIDTGGNPEGVRIKEYTDEKWSGDNFYGFGRLKVVK